MLIGSGRTMLFLALSTWACGCADGEPSRGVLSGALAALAPCGANLTASDQRAVARAAGTCKPGDNWTPRDVTCEYTATIQTVAAVERGRNIEPGKDGLACWVKCQGGSPADLQRASAQPARFGAGEYIDWNIGWDDTTFCVELLAAYVANCALSEKVDWQVNFDPGAKVCRDFSLDDLKDTCEQAKPAATVTSVVYGTEVCVTPPPKRAQQDAPTEELGATP